MHTDPSLPTVLRLPPHRSLLSRGPYARLVGLDPTAAVEVDDLTEPLAGLLDDLVVPTDRAALVDRAVRRGASPDEVDALLRELTGAGIVVDAAGPQRTAQRRAEATVLVDGEGPLAVGVACGLVLAGVGTVHVRAVGTVREGDLGTGHLDADRGSSRVDALVAAVHRLVPTARAGPPPSRSRADLTVLADIVGPPERAAALVRRGSPHLLVRLRDGTGVVGPLVLPGRSACLACLELHRAELDPGWPAVAEQLADRPGTADPACVTATTGLATAQALAALDGATGHRTTPPVLDATLEIDVDTGSITRRSWTPHPRCRCGALGRRPATSAQSHGGGTIVR